MATLDLEQQEQLDQAKHFWKQYGNLITWLLVLALAGYAGWTGYLYWQNDRALKAAGLYEELDRSAAARDNDRLTRISADLRGQYGNTTYAQHGALMAARAQAEAGQVDDARASLQWLVDQGKNPDLVAIARLRLAGLQMDAAQFDQALKTLDATLPEPFTALQADRRGDIHLAQGRKDEAIKAWQAAFKAMDPSVEYRRFIEGKLTSMGVATEGAKPEPKAEPKA